MTNPASETDRSELDVGRDRQDELFAALSHPRRRFTLQYLRTADAPLPVAELAAELVTWEDETTAIDGSGEARTDVEIALMHVHLPKMAEADFVDYDASRRTVALADRSDEASTQLRAMTTD